MPRSTTSLSEHQQELVNIVKAAHRTLMVARKTRSGEQSRRLAEVKIDMQRRLEEAETQIRLDMDAEIAAHAAAQDEALIAAYEAGIPIRRLALDGFGNQYDGAVASLLVALRDDGRVGNAEGYRRNTTDPDDIDRSIEFPKPVDVDAVLNEALTLIAPTFTLNEGPLELVAPHSGDTGTYVEAVTISMDARDPYFGRIAKNMRPGSPHAKATTATLYIHPFSGELTVFESSEPSEQYWDHPVARYCKEHAEEVRAGFDRAIAEAHGE